MDFRKILFFFEYIHVFGVFPKFWIHFSFYYERVCARVGFVNILVCSYTNPTRAHTL